MPTFRESAQVDASAEQAWKTAADLRVLGDWLVMHEAWRGEIPDELALDTRFTTIVSLKGMRNRVAWEVVDFDPPRELTLNGLGVGGTRIALRLATRPKGDRTSVSFDLEFDGPLIVLGVGAAIKRALSGDVKRSIRRLAALIG